MKIERRCSLPFISVLAMVLVCSTVGLAKKEVHTGPCMKSVSSAIARSDGADSLFPDFVTHWWEKNARNYPGVCLTSKPNATARNYLLVFSTSAQYYSGLMPTTHTFTSTSSSTLNANGSLVDQSGNTWLYTATGNAQTTTTATVHENVPYTDRYVGLFLRTYDSTGRIIRSDGHVYRSRIGGDSSSTAGYNIGSALSNINARGKMLRSALLAITSDQDAPLPAIQAEAAKVETVSESRSASISVAPGSAAQQTRASAPASGAVVEISSDPLGADIEIDGDFVGNTPSSVGIAAGEHTVTISKAGYKQWERVLKSTAGNIRIAAVLNPIPTAVDVHQDGNQSGVNRSSPSIASTSIITDPEPTVDSSPGMAEEDLIGISCAGNPTVRHDGIEVTSVQPKGLADSIGIKSGDLILAVDGHYLYTIDGLRAELRGHRPGAQLTIRYRHYQLTYENRLVLARDSTSTSK